jgi:hypothetical protein
MNAPLSLLSPLFIALLQVTPLPAKPAPAGEPPRGQVVDKITCAGNPGETYALYLPDGYTPDRAWPILYILDPRSRGALAAERFRPGAEAFGYILASSNNSVSDGAMEPNLKSMRAMWADTHARFTIDDRRHYAAGFSGTAWRSSTAFTNGRRPRSLPVPWPGWTSRR